MANLAELRRRLGDLSRWLLSCLILLRCLVLLLLLVLLHHLPLLGREHLEHGRVVEHLLETRWHWRQLLLLPLLFFFFTGAADSQR